jgi:hypothetical protein
VRFERPVRSGCAVFSVGFVLAIWAITADDGIVENGPALLNGSSKNLIEYSDGQ